MKASSARPADTPRDHTRPNPIKTTLYDLIVAISDEVDPEDDDLVTATVVHLMNAGRVKFTDDPRRLEAVWP